MGKAVVGGIIRRVHVWPGGGLRVDGWRVRHQNFPFILPTNKIVFIFIE